MQRTHDILIAGGGIAGAAASRLLAGAGFEVACIDPEPVPGDRVGESLDWSAPPLLAELALPVDHLVETGLGNLKREIRARSLGGTDLVGRPRPWLHRWPLRFELTTVHLDRRRFDEALHHAAREAGAVFIRDRVTRLERRDDRVLGCITASGDRYSAPWFIDASGRARLLARSAGVGSQQFGTTRMALWSRLRTAPPHHLTELSFDAGDGQLGWAWEIPLTTDSASVGLVMPLTRFRSQRARGVPLAELLAGELTRHPRFADVEPVDLGRVRARSYRAYVADRTAGANWLLAGEAAAFVDPLTSLGVTTAFRHASEAAGIIRRSTRRPAGTRRLLRAYDARVRSTAMLANVAINDLLYAPTVRRRFGLRAAARAYVIQAYVTNSLYPRLRSHTLPGSKVLLALQGLARQWTRAWLAAAGGTAPTAAAEEVALASGHAR
jgi:flavin-dependent dehydrogenase